MRTAQRVEDPDGVRHWVVMEAARTNGEPPTDGLALEIRRELRGGAGRGKVWHRGWEHRGEAAAREMFRLTCEDVESGELRPARREGRPKATRR